MKKNENISIEEILKTQEEAKETQGKARKGVFLCSFFTFVFVFLSYQTGNKYIIALALLSLAFALFYLFGFHISTRLLTLIEKMNKKSIDPSNYCQTNFLIDSDGKEVCLITYFKAVPKEVKDEIRAGFRESTKLILVDKTIKKKHHQWVILDPECTGESYVLNPRRVNDQTIQSIVSEEMFAKINDIRKELVKTESGIRKKWRYEVMEYFAKILLKAMNTRRKNETQEKHIERLRKELDSNKLSIIIFLLLSTTLNGVLSTAAKVITFLLVVDWFICANRIQKLEDSIEKERSDK